MAQPSGKYLLKVLKLTWVLELCLFILQIIL